MACSRENPTAVKDFTPVSLAASHTWAQLSPSDVRSWIQVVHLGLWWINYCWSSILMDISLPKVMWGQAHDLQWWRCQLIIKRICPVGWRCCKFLRCNTVLIHHLWSFELVPFSVSIVDLEWWRINLETSRLKYKVSCGCLTCWSLWSLLNTWKSIFHFFSLFSPQLVWRILLFHFGWCGTERERYDYVEDQPAALHYTRIQGKHSPLIYERLYISRLLTFFLEPWDARFYLVLQ